MINHVMYFGIYSSFYIRKMDFEGKELVCNKGWIKQPYYLQSWVDIDHVRNPWLNMFKNRKSLFSN